MQAPSRLTAAYKAAPLTPRHKWRYCVGRGPGPGAQGPTRGRMGSAHTQVVAPPAAFGGLLRTGAPAPGRAACAPWGLAASPRGGAPARRGRPRFAAPVRRFRPRFACRGRASRAPPPAGPGLAPGPVRRGLRPSAVVRPGCCSRPPCSLGGAGLAVGGCWRGPASRLRARGLRPGPPGGLWPPLFPSGGPGCLGCCFLCAFAFLRLSGGAVGVGGFSPAPPRPAAPAGGSGVRWACWARGLRAPAQGPLFGGPLGGPPRGCGRPPVRLFRCG